MNQQDITKKTNPIRSAIRLSISLKKQSEVLEILESVHKQVRFEPKCLHARLYREANEAENIMIEELWSDDEGLRQHLQSDAYRRILLVIEMANVPPEILFDKIIQSSGIETIQKERNNI